MRKGGTPPSAPFERRSSDREDLVVLGIVGSSVLTRLLDQPGLGELELRSRDGFVLARKTDKSTSPGTQDDPGS